jgi:hypothetical protein
MTCNRDQLLRLERFNCFQFVPDRSPDPVKGGAAVAPKAPPFEGPLADLPALR